MNMAAVPNPEDYEVHPVYGFLAENPLTELPPYFSPWTDIAFNFQEYNTDGSMRKRVHELPLLDHSRLGDDVRAWRFAHHILSAMAQSYVWCEGPDHVPEMLPRQIAIPLKAASDHLVISPCYCYYPAYFCNYKWKTVEGSEQIPDKRVFNPEDLETILTVSGGEAEKWFFVMVLVVELAGVEGIMAAIEAQKNVLLNNAFEVALNLGKLESSLRHMIKMMQRFKDGCSPADFLNDIRPFFLGWTSAPFERKNLRGLKFEGVNDEPVGFPGLTASQSPTMPVFDAALKTNPIPPADKHLLASYNLIPPQHRRFVEAVEAGPSIKDYVLRVKDSHCSEMFDRCVQAVADFRNQHIKNVMSFRVIVSNEAAKSTGNQNEIDQVSRGNRDVLAFLKRMRGSQISAGSSQGNIGSSVVTWVQWTASRFVNSAWTRRFVLGASAAICFTIYMRK